MIGKQVISKFIFTSMRIITNNQENDLPYKVIKSGIQQTHIQTCEMICSFILLART